MAGVYMPMQSSGCRYTVGRRVADIDDGVWPATAQRIPNHADRQAILGEDNNNAVEQGRHGKTSMTKGYLMNWFMTQLAILRRKISMNIPSLRILSQPLLLLVISFLAMPVLAKGSATPKIVVQGSEIQINQTIPEIKQPSIPVLNRELLVISANPRGNIGPQGKSGPVCGGVIGGVPQKPCGSVPATFESDAVANCPAGSFFDIGKWSCWSCPTGFERTAEAVDAARACAKRDSSVRSELKSASFAGSLCPSGSFYDPIRGGECWSCPVGYKRSAAHIDAANACFVPAGERLSRATRVKNTIWPHECPGGTFHDGWNGGACWRCPGGYNRTANHINTDKACSASFSEQQARARVVKKAQCETGEFQDPRNGGECWSCPTETSRTLSPVNGNKACEKPGGFRYARATQESVLTCPAGEIFDLASSKNSNVMTRIRTQVGSNPMPEGIGKSNGGTCWSCPAGSTRSTTAVWGKDACALGVIDWQPAPYGQPGLFGLDGAEEVALALIQERKLIDSIADSMVPTIATTSAKARQLVWEEIAAEPHNSSALNLAALARVQAAVAKPAQATEAERRLAASFVTAVRDFRVFMAQNALDAYDAWKVAEEYWKSQTRSKNPTNMSALYDYGTVPPDFAEITAGSILGGLATRVGLSTAWTIAGMQPSVVNAIFPFRKAARESASKAAQKASGKLAEKIGEQIAKKTATETALAAGKTVGKVGAQILADLGSIGPQVIVTVAVELLAIAIEDQIDIQNARPILLTNLASAKQPVDLARLLKTEEGSSEVENFWVTAMGGEVLATNAPALATAAKVVLASTNAVPSVVPSVVAAPAPAMPAVSSVAGAVAKAALPKFDIMSNNQRCVQAVSGGSLTLVPCGRALPTYWISSEGKLKTGPTSGECMTNTGGRATITACDGRPIPTQKWDYQKGHITSANLCLEAVGSAMAVRPCSPFNPKQMWQVDVK